MFSLIDSYEKDITGQKYRIEFSYVDLRPMRYNKKIKEFLHHHLEEKTDHDDNQHLIEHKDYEIDENDHKQNLHLCN